MVAADPGRGAADARGGRARRGLGRARRAASRSGSRAGDVAIMRGPDHYTVADDPATRRRPSSTPASAARRPTARARRRCGTSACAPGATARTATTVMLTGTYQLDGEVSRRLLRALPPLLVAARGRWDCPLDPAAGRRDRQGRAGPGGRARPPARPAADRRAARLVRAPGGGGARLVPRLRRPGRRPGAAAAAPQPGASRGRSRRWPTRPASRAPRSPGASTSSSASRR